MLFDLVVKRVEAVSFGHVFDETYSFAVLSTECRKKARLVGAPPYIMG